MARIGGTRGRARRYVFRSSPGWPAVIYGHRPAVVTHRELAGTALWVGGQPVPATDQYTAKRATKQGAGRCRPGSWARASWTRAMPASSLHGRPLSTDIGHIWHCWADS